jgi:hypothetical protein
VPRKCKIKLAYKKKPAAAATATPSGQAAASGGQGGGRSFVLLLMKVRAGDAAFTQPNDLRKLDCNIY